MYCMSNIMYVIYTAWPMYCMSYISYDIVLYVICKVWHMYCISYVIHDICYVRYINYMLYKPYEPSIAWPMYSMSYVLYALCTLWAIWHSMTYVLCDICRYDFLMQCRYDFLITLQYNHYIRWTIHTTSITLWCVIPKQLYSVHCTLYICTVYTGL